MRLLQPVPSERGTAGPQEYEELQFKEAEKCSKDGKVCYVVPDKISDYGGKVICIV